MEIVDAYGFNFCVYIITNIPGSSNYQQDSYRQQGDQFTRQLVCLSNLNRLNSNKQFGNRLPNSLEKSLSTTVVKNIFCNYHPIIQGVIKGEFPILSPSLITYVCIFPLHSIPAQRRRRIHSLFHHYQRKHSYSNVVSTRTENNST